MSAVERWRARLPATERQVTYAARAPKMFRSGRCGNPACGEWVTTWVTMGKAIHRLRARLARGTLWRPAGSPPSRFCSDLCSDVAAGRVKPVPPPPPVKAAKKPKVVHPHAAKFVGRTVWASAYCRRPACRAGFITLLPVIDGVLGPRPPFCSDGCQRAAGTVLRGPLAAARRRASALASAGKALAVRQSMLTPTLPTHIVAAGWCARPACGQPFNLFMPLWSPTGEVFEPPRFCSVTCWRRDKYLREDRAAAVARAAELCQACWSDRRSRPYAICTSCFEVLRESCRRKRRRSEEAAKNAATHRTRIEDRSMCAYFCEMCRHWHIGGTANGWRAKRVTFVAWVFVQTAPAGEIKRLIEAWNPHNMDLNQRLAKHEGLAALRNQLELEGARW